MLPFLKITNTSPLIPHKFLTKIRALLGRLKEGFESRFPLRQAKRPWLRKILLAACVLFPVLFFLSLVRFFRAPEHLQASLLAQAEENLGADLSFQEAKIVFRPFPLLRLTRPHLEVTVEGLSHLSAEEADFSFHWLPLLWGRIRLSGFRIREGKADVWEIPFEHLQLKFTGSGLGGSAVFHWKASLAGEKTLLQGKGKLHFQKGKENFWKALKFQTKMAFSGFSLAHREGASFLKYFPTTNLSGTLAGAVQFEKESGKNFVNGKIKFQVKDFQSKNSGKFSPAGEAELLWNAENNSVHLKQLSFKTPFGEVGGAAVFNPETRQIQEARVTGHKVILDELVRYFPSLHSALPLDIGFSGENEFDLTFGGSWDYLSLHANWDLTSAVLTYGNIFSKPKDFPMRLNFDFLLKDGSTLSGDLSLRLHDTTLKGAIVKLNLKSGLGEMTFLTNKFDVKGWEKLLTPLTSYRMSGEAKVLLSFKGNLTQLDKTEKMMNLTLENVNVLTPTGRGLRGIHALMDVSPLSLRVTRGAFQTAGSVIRFEAEIYNLQENPQGKIQIHSPKLEPFALLDSARALKAFLYPGKHLFPGRKLKMAMNRFLPKPLGLEELTLKLELQKDKLNIQDLEFQALEGHFKIEGEVNQASEKSNFQLGLVIDKISLAQYFEGRGQESFLEGNFFLNGRFQGEIRKGEEIPEKLSGQGTLSVTNGEWHTLDLVSSLSHLEPFQNFTLAPSHSTSFDDLKASWKWDGKKFETSDLILHSKDFWIEGEGHLTLEGILNSKLEIYLSSSLSDEFLDSLKVENSWQGKQLGPIPFLIVGSLAKPEPKADDLHLQPFLEAFRARRFRRIMSDPFTKS